MEELIFFAVIILFSIVESISRSRKAKARQQSGESAEAEQFEWAQTPPWEAEVPTYDDDPSYDDEAVARQDEPVRAPGGESAADIWAEIASLASGTKEKPGAAARPQPTPSPPSEPPTSSDAEVRRQARLTRAEEAKALQAARAQATRTREVSRPVGRNLSTRRTVAPAQHQVHLAHAGYGTDPSSRAPSEQDGLDPLAEYISADAAAIHAQLRSRSASALRQAIILHEVLGPPVSLRD